MVNFMVYSLYPNYPFGNGMGGVQSRFRRDGVKNNC